MHRPTKPTALLARSSARTHGPRLHVSHALRAIGMRTHAATPIASCIQPARREVITFKGGDRLTYGPAAALRRFFCHDASHASTPAEKCVSTIYAALLDSKEATRDTFDPTMQGAQLVLHLGEKGQYSLEPTPDGRLCLFSPVSGPRWYEYDKDNAWFANKQDGHLLIELLVRELMHSTSVYVNL